MKPIAVILGRPNVGKSTLFNRITKSRKAIVDDLPGVTRDRNFGDAVWNDTVFTLVDTGGYLTKDADEFANQIRTQVDFAIEDADAIILTLDGKAGPSPFDSELIEILRRVKKPVFFIVNKIDGEEQEPNLYEFYNLGIENLFPVSGEHGYGVPDFLDALINGFPDFEPDETDDMIKISVIGKPNVGKSSLVNRILGKNRMVVSDVPGTTRDSIDSICKINNKSYLMIDTAGIRRKGKVNQKLEKFSIIKALKALERCDIALIVIDAADGITEQDIRIAGYAYDRKCGCIFILNKWDLIEKEKNTVKLYYERLKDEAKFLSFAPAITISALTGQRVPKLFNLIDTVFNQFSKKIKTGQVNKMLTGAVKANEPSLHQGSRIKFYYATQTATKPPTFTCFVNFPNAVHFSYKRYLINQIRERAGLEKIPVKLIYKERPGRKTFSRKKFTERMKKHKKRNRT